MKPRWFLMAVLAVSLLSGCEDQGDHVDCDPIEMEFASAPLRLGGGLHEFRLRVTVAVCEREAELFPDDGRVVIQSALDETVASVNTLSELYSERIGERVRAAINREAAKDLVESVRVICLDHTEYEHSPSVGSEAKPDPSVGR